MNNRKYICFNPEIKQKISQLYTFINRYRCKENREKLFKFLYTMETLLYADYNRSMAVSNFLIEVNNVKFLYNEIESLFDKKLKKDLKECIEYFESAAVILKLSKGGN